MNIDKINLMVLIISLWVGVTFSGCDDSGPPPASFEPKSESSAFVSENDDSGDDTEEEEDTALSLDCGGAKVSSADDKELNKALRSASSGIHSLSYELPIFENRDSDTFFMDGHNHNV